MKLKTDQIITKGTRRKIKKNKNQNEKKNTRNYN